jgi:flavorubredoxin
VADAFKFGTLVFAAATYNGGIFTPMDNLLRDLTAHNLQNRRVATLDNGTWAAMAGKQMREEIAKWKNCSFIEPHIAIKSALTDTQQSDFDALADAIVAEM